MAKIDNEIRELCETRGLAFRPWEIQSVTGLVHGRPAQAVATVGRKRKRCGAD